MTALRASRDSQPRFGDSAGYKAELKKQRAKIREEDEAREEQEKNNKKGREVLEDLNKDDSEFTLT